MIGSAITRAIGSDPCLILHRPEGLGKRNGQASLDPVRRICTPLAAGEWRSSFGLLFQEHPPAFAGSGSIKVGKSIPFLGLYTVPSCGLISLSHRYDRAKETRRKDVRTVPSRRLAVAQPSTPSNQRGYHQWRKFALLMFRVRTVGANSYPVASPARFTT